MTTYPQANKARGGRIPVRGKCPDGHTTETISDPGRITWSGECAADGCAHRITAKRIPKAREQPPAGDDVHTPPEPEPETVKEVDYAQQPPAGRRVEEPPAEPAGAGDVPPAPAGTGPAARDVDEHNPGVEYEPGEPERPRGIVDTSGPGLVDQRPPRRRRPREHVRHEFRLPWD